MWWWNFSTGLKDRAKQAKNLPDFLYECCLRLAQLEQPPAQRPPHQPSLCAGKLPPRPGTGAGRGAAASFHLRSLATRGRFGRKGHGSPGRKTRALVPDRRCWCRSRLPVQGEAQPQRCTARLGTGSRRAVATGRTNVGEREENPTWAQSACPAGWAHSLSCSFSHKHHCLWQTTSMSVPSWAGMCCPASPNACWEHHGDPRRTAAPHSSCHPAPRRVGESDARSSRSLPRHGWGPSSGQGTAKG